MASFDLATKVVLGHEGGYVNDPVDRGSKTNWVFAITSKHVEPAP